MHRVGGETPEMELGAHQSKPVNTTWCSRLPGPTRMRYDRASSYQGMTLHLDAISGARKQGIGGLPIDAARL